MRSANAFELNENCQNSALRSDGFFSGAAEPVLKKLDSITYVMGFPEEAALFFEGESPRAVFMLCKGRVKLSMTSSQGKTIILGIAEPGNILGIDAAISGTPYQTTAEALEPSQVKFVARDDFLHFIRNNVEASLHIAAALGQNYKTACRRIRTLGLSHSAPERLARFLLDWTDGGLSTKDGTRARLTLTHEEIGQIIGASRETVTRIFHNFRAKQLVTVRGSTLLIQNRPGLENFLAS